jgi:hypothetical protein
MFKIPGIKVSIGDYRLMVNKIQLVGVGRSTSFAAKKITPKFDLTMAHAHILPPPGSYLKYKVRFNPQLTKQNFCKNVLELF